jgi:hypothetical protein
MQSKTINELHGIVKILIVSFAIITSLFYSYHITLNTINNVSLADTASMGNQLTYFYAQQCFLVAVIILLSTEDYLKHQIQKMALALP